MSFAARSIRFGGACTLLLTLAACASSADSVDIGSVNNFADAILGPPATTSAEPIAPGATVPPPLKPAVAVAPPAPFGQGPVNLTLASYVTAAPGTDPAAAADALSPTQVAIEADRLRAAMAYAVPHGRSLSPARQQELITLAKTMAAEDHLFIRRPQIVLIVDRSLTAQLMAMTLARPDGDWEILGTSPVSTGKPGRKEHFKTPVGVLLNDGSEIGYRAQGTYNQNHIRGLGVKGMRVWDFGWQTSDDWRTPGATMEVRVEMHATDPAVLEQRLGRANSEGCIRLPDALNRFLDHHGIIDADLEKLAETDIGYRALLPANAEPTPLAGDAVIVVDSSEPWAKPYPPETTVALSD